MSAHEREALEDLITSAGWGYFKDAMEQAWGAEATLQRLGQVTLLEDPGAARTIVAARDAVVRMLTWPGERLRELSEYR